MVSTFIIAEAGVNHNGSVDTGTALIDAAAAAGADAVKFQTFTAATLVTQRAERAAYQQRNMGGDEGQYAMLKRLELSHAEFAALNAHADRCGITFLSTPFDDASARFLVEELGMTPIKIPSGEVNNLPFLRYLASFRRPVILSTGMSDIDEVDQALVALREDDAALPVTLLHCTTNYPCPFDEVNLRAMATLRHRFGCPVGYSDHTMGIEVPIAAAAMGATVIEKHFTLDRAAPGPDHRCSLEPDELRRMVAAIRHIETALGDGTKRPTAAETAIRSLVRRSLVARRDLPAGAMLTRADLQSKRPAGGIPPAAIDQIVGRMLCRGVRADAPLMWEDLEGGQAA